jgi:hypothetical protein
MHLLSELAHFDIDDLRRSHRGVDNRWDGQGIDV